MHHQTISLQLTAVQVPVPKWQQHLKWVEWGPKHGFMKEVLALIKGSPTASAMLGKKAQFIAGEGFVCDGAKYPLLADFLKKVAAKGKYRTASQLLQRSALDKSYLYAFAYQIIWSKGDNPKILEVRHQRIETVASGPLNEDGEVETYFLCRDWADQSKYPPKPIAAFNPDNARRDGVQLLVWFKEGPGVEYYPELGFEPALNDMKAEGRLGRYRDNSIRTKFGANTVVALHEGPKDITRTENGKEVVITAKQQQKAFIDDANKQFQGEEANGIIYLFGDGTAEGAEKMIKVIPLSSASPETYEKIAQQAEQAIMKTGGVTSPVVIGLPSTGGLGSNGTEIEKAYEMFFNAECRPSQVDILQVWYEKILPYAGVEQNLPDLTADEPALDIVTNLPVKFMFSEATLELILNDDELRAMIGYKPMKPGQQPAKTAPAEPGAPAPADAAG